MTQVVGIGLTIVGAICDAAGYVIEKKGHLEVIEKNEINEILEEDSKKLVPWCNKIWICGFIVYFIGSILNAIALGFGSQSVLAPLRMLSLVVNAILATRVLGEPFERNKWIGILLVLVGSVLSCLYGPQASTETLDLDSLKEYWSSEGFLMFFGIWTGIIIIDYIVLKFYEHKNWKDDHDAEIEHGSYFMLGSYVSIAAYYASFGMVLMKSLMTILSTFDPVYFEEPIFYVSVVPIIPVNVLLEVFRQKALHHFEANYVVPLYQVSFVLGSIVIGGVFYKEFTNLSETSYIVFPISICITLFGVAILAYDVGKFYTKMMQSLHLKHVKTLSPRAKAKKHFTSGHHHAVNKETLDVFSAWGGFHSQLGAEMISMASRRSSRIPASYSTSALAAEQVHSATSDDSQDTEDSVARDAVDLLL